MNDKIVLTVSEYEELILENFERMRSNDVIIHDGFMPGRAKEYVSFYFDGADIKELAEQAAAEFHSDTVINR